MDFFCLSGSGIRAGYASPGLSRTLARRLRGRVRGRVVLALTANRHFALAGIRPGAMLPTARRRLRLSRRFVVGRNTWYLATPGSLLGVLKVRRGRVEEIGIADSRLTGTRAATRRFLSSFR
jgi:hypothetical protein